VIAVYLAHQYTGTPEERSWNRANATAWCVWLLEQGFSPSANWIMLTGSLEETPENRRRGLACDLDQVKRQDVILAVGPRLSDGMQRELEGAHRGIVIATADRTEFPATASELDMSQSMALQAAIVASSRAGGWIPMPSDEEPTQVATPPSDEWDPAGEDPPPVELPKGFQWDGGGDEGWVVRNANGLMVGYVEAATIHKGAMWFSVGAPWWSGPVRVHATALEACQTLAANWEKREGS